MVMLFLMGVLQHGPADGILWLQRYLWILLLILVPLLIILLYRLILPDLKKVSVVDNLETKVAEKKSLKEISIKDENLKEPIKRVSEVEAQDQPLIEIALKFLQADERRIVKALLEANGSMLQKDISWETGFSRVKTHRVLARLISRGVVYAEKYYNTNRITLSDFLLEDKNK